MKTIEERANKFALEKHPYSPFCEEYAKMYIEIATEQKAIDIDKACEWVDDNVGTLTAIAFRKAMEGEK